MNELKQEYVEAHIAHYILANRNAQRFHAARSALIAANITVKEIEELDQLCFSAELNGSRPESEFAKLGLSKPIYAGYAKP